MKENLLALRKFKYRSLEDLKRKVVRINSFASVEREVLNTVGIQVPEEFHMTTSRTEFAGGLGKYGILDLEFEAAAALPDTDRAGSTVLRDLYFMNDAEKDQESNGRDTSDPTCISLLIEHLDDRKTFLKLFLQCDSSQDAMRRIIGESKRDPNFERTGLVENTVARLVEESEQRLPRDFVIEDACLTNSTYVWLHRHLWL